MLASPCGVLSERVNVGVQEHLHQRHEEGAEQPEVDHLDVGGGGQRVGDADEDGGEDEEAGQVDRHRCLKEEGLEVVGGEAHDADEAGGQVRGHNGAEQSVRKSANNLDTITNYQGV